MFRILVDLPVHMKYKSGLFCFLKSYSQHEAFRPHLNHWAPPIAVRVWKDRRTCAQMAFIPRGDCKLVCGSLAFIRCRVCLANDDINLGAKGIMHYSIRNQLLNLNSKGNKFVSRRVINSQGPEPSNLYLHEQPLLLQAISLGCCLGKKKGPCKTGHEELASEGTTSLINRLKHTHIKKSVWEICKYMCCLLLTNMKPERTGSYQGCNESKHHCEI